MRKTYKYRLLGNNATFARADEWLALCQRLYNLALEQRIYIYRYNKKTISCYVAADGSNNVTFITGTNVTVAPSAKTVAGNTTLTMYCELDNITSGSEAVTIY